MTDRPTDRPRRDRSGPSLARHWVRPHHTLLAGRRRHVWVSVSNDLLHDARRDLSDVLGWRGAAHLCPIPIRLLSGMSYERVSSQRFKSGVLFVTTDSFCGAVFAEPPCLLLLLDQLARLPLP